MKRIITLLLATVMCLPMAACSNNEKYTQYDTLIQMIEADDYQKALCELDKFFGEQTKLKDIVIGTWIREYVYNDENYVTTIEIFPGGTGTFQTQETYHWVNPYINGTELPDNTTWEIKDDILNITIKDPFFGDSVKGYIYVNDEKESLQTVDGKMVYYRKSE